MPPQGKQTKRPSMYDVARLAGVSRTTVSFVVNNRPDAAIPQETQDRVWAAVKELGWRPNAMARSLSSQRSHTIGFLTDEIATSPFAGQIIQGAQDAAWTQEKLLIVVNTNGDPAIKAAAVEMMLERQVEGILYAVMYHRAVTLPASVHEVPTVVVNGYSADRSFASVVPDEVQGGCTATDVLLSRGHRRIGFINNVDPIPATHGRREGYTQTLATYGVPFDAALVRAGKSSPAEGYRCAMELMQLPDRPTALFCFSDLMAMGAYDALRKLGLAIPDDVAVIGFDNHELIAAHLYPPLSTMALPFYAMGQWATDYLLTLLEDDASRAPIQKMLPCPYIARVSV